MQAQHSKIKETETTVNEIWDLLQSFCAIQLEPVILFLFLLLLGLGPGPEKKYW